MNDWLARMLFPILRPAGPDISDSQRRRELQNLQGTLRFITIFGLTVVLPMLALGGFALTSIEGEEFLAEREVLRSADAIVNQVYFDTADHFDRFEARALERLEDGESVLSNLGEMSPHLRCALQFSANGELRAPFRRSEESPVQAPAARFEIAFQQGRMLAVQGQGEAALDALDNAISYATTPQADAEARFARAVVLAQLGAAKADDELADIYADHANARDRYGFRFGDLALLKRGEIALLRDPDVGAVALRQLVDELLADQQWLMGYTSEMSVVSRALKMLESRGESQWLARSRSRHAERSAQLFWAESTQHEQLDLLVAVPGRPGQFGYTARPNSHSLWAVIAWEGSIYAFSFDRDSLREVMTAHVAAASSVEPDIVAWITTSDAARPGALVTRPFQPWIPWEAVVTAPRDPMELARMTRGRRNSRIAIIFIILATVLVGIGMSARIVSGELETARMKTDFAANVSHELRSPITNIRVQAEALMLDLVFDEEDRQQHHVSIVQEAERLSRLVDNVLDFAAIERGAKKYHFRPEDPCELLQKALEIAVSRNRNVEIEADIPDDLPVVWIDREAMSQVLINLISNAVKYGGDNKWLGLRAAVQQDELRVEVEDRGIGLKPEDAEQVFEHFFRSSDPQVRKQKGTGIGLAIVRYIVEAHRGTISVRSTYGEGTTFIVMIPLQPPPPSTTE